MTGWAFAVYFLAILALVGGLLLASHFLGERHREPATGRPYESGIAATGRVGGRLSAHFYLVAMFFVIFDLQAMFLVAWSVVAADAGWLGYWGILVFAAVLLTGLAYLWRAGALDWGTSGRLRQRRPAGEPLAAERERRAGTEIPERWGGGRAPGRRRGYAPG